MRSPYANRIDALVIEHVAAHTGEYYIVANLDVLIHDIANLFDETVLEAAADLLRESHTV
jgi:hypothetical protein